MYSCSLRRCDGEKDFKIKIRRADKAAAALHCSNYYDSLVVLGTTRLPKFKFKTFRKLTFYEGSFILSAHRFKGSF